MPAALATPVRLLPVPSPLKTCSSIRSARPSRCASSTASSVESPVCIATCSDTSLLASMTLVRSNSCSPNVEAWRCHDVPLYLKGFVRCRHRQRRAVFVDGGDAGRVRREAEQVAQASALGTSSERRSPRPSAEVPLWPCILVDGKTWPEATLPRVVEVGTNIRRDRMGLSSLSPASHETPSTTRSRPGVTSSASITAARSSGSRKFPPSRVSLILRQQGRLQGMPVIIWPNVAVFRSLPMIVLRCKTCVLSSCVMPSIASSTKTLDAGRINVEFVAISGGRKPLEGSHLHN